ncbi:MAG: 5-oxoprolinase subunit PxpA [Pyrinomonadaceae bacterium]
MLSVDLNCDMGEGCGNDAELMDYVSSVNVACGFHAGDAATMRTTVETAIEKGVAIGAHPSFPDRDRFGRNTMNMPSNQVYDIVLEQIFALRDICNETGGKLRHVKPHGALYNQAARDPQLANAITTAVKAVDEHLILFGLSGSVLITKAQKCGLRSASEVFADRTYSPDGSLTPRSEPNALIHDTDTAVTQVLQMVKNRTVTSTGGKTIKIDADTICIHGDGENAVDFAKSIRRKLIENGIEIRAING